NERVAPGGRRHGPAHQGAGGVPGQRFRHGTSVAGRDFPELLRGQRFARGEAMMTIFRYTLGRFRGQILGWGIAMLLIDLLAVARFDIMRENQPNIQPMLEKEGGLGSLMRLFGDPKRLFDPKGFLSMQIFNQLPLFLGVFAVLAGSGLLAS